ncbi:hypothetical protein [Candidatus Pseudoruminococcus sp.]|uniref:hypothetical protein n=1 Tax=Candidatus Pseudoruminococcus sp. TaxID=3101048 RepID=UPI00399997DA
MKNNKVIKTFATVAIGAALIAGTTIGAATVAFAANNTAISTQANQSSKAYVFTAYGKTSYGYDWTYSADNTNIKVDVKYDFATNKYTCTFTGLREGTCNMDFKYYTSDKNIVTVPMILKVDKNLNITRTDASSSSSSSSNTSKKESSSSTSSSTSSKTANSYVFTAYGKTSYGYDWTYSADNTNIKVDVKYDFGTNKYTCTFTGLREGTCNMNFKYYTSDKSIVTVPMVLKVDSSLNIARLS